MTSKTNKLKWLLSLVLIFGGFAVYQIFEVLAHDFENTKYSWVFQIIAEFGLFSSVMVSVGHFHHWLIAAEEHKETEKSFYSALIRYVDSVLSGSVNRGFTGITDKGMDFTKLMHGLKHGDHVYWLITFDPRYKHHVREIENGLKDGIHFRLIIIKEQCTAVELRAREIKGYNSDEFNEYAKLFKDSLEDMVSRIDGIADGSLGVYVSDGLPSIPLLIIIRNKSREVEVFSSFYLTEPIGRMPYLKWHSELNDSNHESFETDHWKFTDLFVDYFRKRWNFEKNRINQLSPDEQKENTDFIFVPPSAKSKCSMLIDE